MRRLLVAAAFSLGLLVSGAVLAAAPAAGVRHAVAETGISASPAQYRDRRDVHRPSYRPAPRPQYHQAPRYQAPPRYQRHAYRAPQRHNWRAYAPPRGNQYGRR